MVCTICVLSCSPRALPIDFQYDGLWDHLYFLGWSLDPYLILKSPHRNTNHFLKQNLDFNSKLTLLGIFIVIKRFHHFFFSFPFLYSDLFLVSDCISTCILIPSAFSTVYISHDLFMRLKRNMYRIGNHGYIPQKGNRIKCWDLYYAWRCFYYIFVSIPMTLITSCLNQLENMEDSKT